MENAHWKGSTDPNIAASDVTGGYFNNANVGLLMCMVLMARALESDGHYPQLSSLFERKHYALSYCKWDACHFGSSGTNGLKWMGIMGCGVLNDSPYNSMYQPGLPVN